MKVPYVNIGVQYASVKGEILERIESILDSGMFILGEEVKAFETTFAEYCGTKYAIGLNSGTDALILSLRSLGIGPGDEVIIPPNSFLATASSVKLVGATPVFADVASDYNISPERVDEAITERTKAIIAVHLTGRPARMDELLAISQKHGIPLIEDAAQAVGAMVGDRRVGGMGIVGCFSLHPLKNLSAAGDGGMITTNDKELYEYFLKARNHGLKNRDECEFWSYNSRLDAVQAAVLNVKIRKLDEWTARRRQIAAMYSEGLNEIVSVPVENEDEFSVYHTYIVRAQRRNELMGYLKQKGVDSKVHYPIPIHYQAASSTIDCSIGDFPETESQAEEILSLPVFPELTDEQIEYVIECIRSFYS